MMSLRVRHPHPIKIKIRRIFMKKKSSIILLFVLAIVTSLCFFGCKKDDVPDNPAPTPAPTKASVTLDKTSLNLDVYESAVLNATAKNVTETLIWSSSNSAVATVDGGKVTAVGAGETTVTVSGSGASATCAVTVTDSHTAPVLRVEHSEIAVALNGTYDLKIETLWKGAAITDPIDYVWSYADGQPEDVVSVENIATGARFTGLKYGSTELYVKADVRGTKLVQKISVKVCNVDITFEITNLTRGETYYEANVALIGTETDPASITPDVKIYDKQTLVDNPAISWTVADDTVANITNGVITALKEGETLAHASYENNDITILVKAYRPIVPLADEVTLETINGTFAITSDIQGAISGVTIADVNVMSSVSGKNFTLDKAKLPKDGAKLGAQKITIETDKAKYVINANIYTKILKTADDILNWQTLAHEQETDLKFWNGYFVLGNDIDMTGKQFNGIFDYYSMNSGPTWEPLPGYEGMTFRDGTTCGFRGTFDGNGYTISNLKITKLTDSLVGQMTPQGVVKNLTFTGAEIGAGAALVSIGGNGSIENVYAEIAAYANGTHVNDRTAVFSQLGKTGAKIKNCVAVFKCATAQSPFFVGMACVESDGVLDGVYGINIDKSYAITSTTASPGVYGAYKSFGALKVSGVDFSSWAGEYWQIINGIPYPKKLALPEANTPAATAPAISGIGKDITVSGLSSNDAIKLSDEAAALGVTVSDNVISVPASVAGGTEISFTVFNIFDDSKKVDFTVLIAESEDIDLENRTEIEMQSFDDLVVDLSSYNLNGEVIGLLIENDSKDITNVTFENGILTLPKSALGNIYGNKDVIVNIATRVNGAITKITTVNVPVLAITKVLKTADDVLNWNTLAYAADSAKEYWGGYFVLGNDIDMAGKEYLGNFSYADLYYTEGPNAWQTKEEFGGLSWVNGWTGGFRGTFDGCGFAIKNMTVAKWNTSFVGQMALGGVIRNVSFTGVTLKAATTLISVGGVGTIENIYAEIVAYDNGSAGDKTGVFFSRDTMADARVNKCFVEFKCNTAVTDGFSALGRYHLGYGQLNGVYAVGAGMNKDSVIRILSSDQDNGTDAYDGYETIAAFKTAGVANWENDFWTMVDGIPAPKKLAQNAGASINNAVTILTSSQRTLNIETSHQYLVYSLDSAALAAGLTISGNVVTIPESSSVSSFTVTATSMLNSAVKAEKTFYIVSSETITVPETTRIDMSISDYLTADLSGYAISGNLTSAKLDGAAIDLVNVTFESGTLTIAKSALGNIYGEKVITLTFETKSGEVVTKITTVNLPVLAITKVLKTADDVLNWNTLAYAADSSKEFWAGYFVLGNDIEMTGKEYLGSFAYSDLNYTEGPNAWQTKEEFGGLKWTNGWTGGFRGTFDGCGFAIKNMTVAKWNTSFVGQMALGGVIRNVSFTGVTLKAATTLISVGGIGTIENIYAEIVAYENGNPGDTTGVFFSRDTMGDARVNKCFVEFKCNTAVADGFTALGRYHLGYGQLNGVYAVGAGMSKDSAIRILSNDQDDGSDAYDGYETIEAFKTAGVANWENDFWTMVDGVPTPKKLSA